MYWQFLYSCKEVISVLCFSNYPDIPLDMWCLTGSLLVVETSLVAQLVKNPPAMQKTWVWSLGQEDPLEKEMATHSSILACGNPMDRGAW